MASSGPTGLGIALSSSSLRSTACEEPAPCAAALPPSLPSPGGAIPKQEDLRESRGPSRQGPVPSESKTSVLRQTLGSETSTAASMRTDGAAKAAFVRSDTLLSFGHSQTRNAAELKALMGNANSRLKAGATVHPLPPKPSGEVADDIQHAVALEQAKHRARVEVDIVLESDTFVQGGFVKGHVKIRVRKRSRKEDPVSLADPKVRVVGFECIPGESERHTFYQCASPLSAIADGLERIFDAPADEEGYARAVEGTHVLPFAMRLPTDSKFGAAKGVLNVHSGVIVQYIAMTSVKVQDSKTGKRSIAHFYRNCEIWPRLHASILLAAAPRPLQASTSKSLSVLSSDRKVRLTAQLHRLVWIAGQRCYINMSVANETKKTLKTLTLTLIRSTTMFKPTPELDAGHARTVDPDACQTNTAHKEVAESVLEMAQQGAKGHVSAKGWWTGVGPGRELSFSHFVLIPPEALSVARSRLLEVEYSIRVTLSAGSLTSDVHVTLPVRIINFLSIDPIPSEPSRSLSVEPVHPLKRRRSIDGELHSRGNESPARSEPSHATPFGTQSRRDSTCGLSDQAADAPNRESSLRVTNPDRAYPSLSSSESSDSESSVYSSDTSYSSSTHADVPAASSAAQRSRGLGNLDLEDPDSDDEVDFVVGSAQLDDSDDSIIAGPEYTSCRTTVRRPLGPRGGGERDRGRTREVRPIQRRNTIMAGALPLREYQIERGEMQRTAKNSFVDGVNERLLASSVRSHHLRGPAEYVHDTGRPWDVDATPRVGQYQTEAPRRATRPRRPSRDPARRTPRPADREEEALIANTSVRSSASGACVTATASSQPSVRRSRALPRPPGTNMATGASDALAMTAAPIIQPIRSAIDGDHSYSPPASRSAHAISVSAEPEDHCGARVATSGGVGCDQQHHTQAAVHTGTPCGRDRDGGSGLRGRSSLSHLATARSESSESSSSESTTSGYESGQSSETSLTSVQAGLESAERPVAGLRTTGSSEGAVQGRIAEIGERVKYARSVASALV